MTVRKQFFFFFTFCGLLHGATAITNTQPTPQQIVVSVTTDQPGNCTYRASEGTVLGALVNDVNPALFAGSNSDARGGAIVAGRRRTFVLGTRKAQQALDNRWRSRSLQANTSHWIGVQCGADAEVSTVARTSNPALGNTWGEPYPYDSTSPLGYAWPTVDFGDKTVNYIDPVTGLLVKRITGLDDAQNGAAPSAPTQAAVTGGGFATAGWSNPQNAAQADGASAVSSSAQPLFVAFSPISVSFSSSRLPSWNASGTTESISDIKVRIAGSGTGGTNNAAVCLTVNGVSCVTEQRNITLPASASTVDYPAGALTGYFSEWIGSTVVTPPATYDLATFNGVVNVSGATVQLTSGNQFDVGAWVPGSHIAIGAAAGCTAGDYTIANLVSDTQLILNSSPGSCTGASYTGYNFGVLIFPQGAATLSVDGVTYGWDAHAMYTNPPSGDNDYCNKTPVTDGSGTKGFICFMPQGAGNMSGYFLPFNFGTPGVAARFLWSSWVYGSTDTTIDYAKYPGDETTFGQVSSYTGGLPTSQDDPTTFYLLQRDTAFTKWVIVSGHYVAAGLGGSCIDPAGYQNYVPVSSTSQNCNIVFLNKTRASQGGTLTDRMAAFDTRFDPQLFPSLQIVATRPGYIVFIASNGQDGFGWAVFVDTQSFQVVAMWPSFANYPIRWSGVHTFVDMGDKEYAMFTTQNAGTRCPASFTSCGPYTAAVTALNGSASGSLPASSSDPTCSGVTDQRVVNLLSNGNGCDVVTLAGNDPCDPNPSAYELSFAPVCTWNPSYRALNNGTAATGLLAAQVEIGDTFIDLATGEGNSGGEVFLVVKNMGGSSWKVLRNFGLSRGPFLDGPKTSTLRAHSANFAVEFEAGLAAKDCEIWGNFKTDPHGTALKCDTTYQPTLHGDRNGTVTVSLEFYEATNQFGYSIRTAPPPFGIQVAQPQSVGKEPNISTNTGVRFGGVFGAGNDGVSNHDGHPSYRQVAAPASEQQWFLDVIRLGSFSGLYTGATVTPVQGTLYRIDGFQQAGAVNIRYRPLLVWSGRHNLADASGPGSVITGGTVDQWKYCYALRAGECVGGSSAGQVFMNVPSANTSGNCTSQANSNSLCVALMSPELDSPSQIGFQAPTANGAFARTLAVPFRSWFMTNSFANVHAVPDGSGAIFTCDFCESIRSDMWWVKIPPTPALDTTVRYTYSPLPVALKGKAGDRVRIRFGYSEHGTNTALYCSSRQESCATDGSGAQPFLWASETQAYSACDTGCTVNIPAITGRVLYYVVDRVNGSATSSSPLQIAVVN